MNYRQSCRLMKIALGIGAAAGFLGAVLGLGAMMALGVARRHCRGGSGDVFLPLSLLWGKPGDPGRSAELLPGMREKADIKTAQ